MPIADTFIYPVRNRYKQTDKIPHDILKIGDLHRTNWINAEYKLLGTIPSVHEADDIVGYGFNCEGLEVTTIGNGVVTNSEHVPTGTWGNLIDIRHTLPDGKVIESKYAHLKDRLVQKGDTVSIGQVIGHIGTADGKLAPHLHFGICVTDLLLHDPRNWPSTGHNFEQAHAIITANYIDPLFFIDSYQVAQPAPENEPAVSTRKYSVTPDGNNLRFRKYYGTSEFVFTLLPASVIVDGYDLTTVASNLTWRLIAYGGRIGWVADKYLVLL